MQTGPLPVQDFPAHLLGIYEELPAAFASNESGPALSPSTEVPPESFGVLRGAILGLPIAVMMWAIIIAALLHFLIA